MIARNILRSVFTLVLLGAAATASAEPYLAAQMGFKCVQCHVNPTGGGLRNVYGDTFAQTVLPQKRIGADDDLWTGQVMKFLSVGGNARANYQWEDQPHKTGTNEFEVEEARAYFDFGVIPNRLSIYIDQRFAPGDSTNMEANVRYWITEGALYVKAGRMYLPFGYRLEDDNAFVRQLSGINMQAPDEGVEIGLEHASWTMQMAVSNGAGGGTEIDPGKQVVTRAEFVQPRWRAGASLLYNDASAGSRSGAGLFGAFNVGPVTLLGEADYFDDKGINNGTKLMATLAEADWKLHQGHNVKLTYEWYEPNRDVDNDEQTRTSLLYEWTPIQFIQLRAGVRVYDGIPQNDNQNRKQAFLQLHGFF
ncbi:MAG TPA: hypothetical protein VGQ27_12825 [Steroidobacteraceae bacterium]|jgi:hypothetical protein|nr:hypothetical protein [Steroidobacteraceae bacterium]